MKKKKLLLTIVCNIIAWILSLICLVPLVLIIFNSLKDSLSASYMNLSLPAFPIPCDNFSTVIQK